MSSCINNFEAVGYQCLQLQDFSTLEHFTCGIPRMDQDIHNPNLRQEIEENHYVAYGVYDEQKHLLAFFAVGQDKYEDPGFAFEIAYLAVRKDLQYQGIGKACIRRINQMAIEKGYKILTVSALSITKPESEKYEAVSFYRRCGFKQYEPQDKNMDIVPMWKRIEPLDEK